MSVPSVVHPSSALHKGTQQIGNSVLVESPFGNGHRRVIEKRAGSVDGMPVDVQEGQGGDQTGALLASMKAWFETM